MEEATAQPTALAVQNDTRPVQNDTRPILIIIISIMLILVSLVGISLRIYSRLTILRKLFADDVLMLMGTITAVILSSAYVVGAHHGFGKHLTQIAPHDLEALRKITFACILLYVMAQLLVKIAVLVLYYRLDQRTLMRFTVYILIFVVLAQNITFFTLQSLSCISIGAASLHHCLSLEKLQLLFNVSGVIVIAIDLAIFIIPLWMLHNLELPAKQKLAGCTVFALAFLPIAAGSLRCYFIWHAIDANDMHYNLVLGGIFAQVEIHLAILCGSASSFKVLLKGIWPRGGRGDKSTASSFTEPPSQPIELPTPWPADQHKLPAVSAAKTSTSTDESWSTLTPHSPGQDEEKAMREWNPCKRSWPSESEVADTSIPAFADFVFPEIESTGRLDHSQTVGGRR